MEFITALQSPNDDNKPSLFELLSEQQLSSIIPPSLRYLLAVATHRHPRYLLRILNSFDEIYALLSLIVERYYLRTYGGGFTENFYGLKRERVLATKGGEIRRAQLGAPQEVRETLKLRRSDVWKNLAIMVALPYVKRKLDESFDIHAASANVLGPSYGNRDAFPKDGTLRQKMFWAYKWFLRRIYPSINAAYYFALLAFNLAYLFDGSKFHSPWLWLVGTRMRRMNAADHSAIDAATAPRPAASGASSRPGQTNSIFHPRTVTHTIYPKMLSSLRVLLPTSIFALKFLEWWHASDFARQLSRKANEGLELPPPTISGSPAHPLPPSKPVAQSDNSEKSQGSQHQSARRDSGFSAGPPISSTTGLPILTVAAPTYADTSAETANTTSLCPICVSPIQTPTAAQTGYVYCYTCIFKWVEGTHPRQETFMEGSKGESDEEAMNGWLEEGGGSRVGKWESGVDRDAVTGRRVLGGTGGLRRVMV
ncbi:peroxisome assembly protein 12 [Polychaeton citri CBS 116435]|uniref:Peroxisome assembly protein 12 n=1 Tax=Polychaeton citri CBS 116435 TaxID=1314669 RepID=A0A9P4QFF9_9PEZI|nr:peroxisome assembly protein 12 [Polychaeton citri CBS 116435]